MHQQHGRSVASGLHVPAHAAGDDEFAELMIRPSRFDPFPGLAAPCRSPAGAHFTRLAHANDPPPLAPPRSMPWR